MVRTRGSSTVFLIGTTNPEPLGKLQKLPTVREFLQRCVHLIAERRSVDAGLKIATDELLVMWSRTAIPVRDKRNVIPFLRKLHQEWGLCKKNKKRDSARKRNFEQKLDSLLDISSAKWEAADDRAKEFLVDQRGCRKFSLAALVGSVLNRNRSAVGGPGEDSGDEGGALPDTDTDYVPETKRTKVNHLV